MPNRSQFKTKEEYNEWFREYRERNREKMRAYYREYNREWRKENGYHNEKKWNKKNPEKVYAQNLLQRAVKLGHIKKLPCEVCGNPKSVGHHDNYYKPLKVRWLCHVHHSSLHRRKFEKE